ncbi:MAG: hypothetical protein ACRELB_03625, partial [Polyangiaceae bacterium]
MSDTPTTTPPSSSSSPSGPPSLHTTDPHASKVAADDPRLRLPRATGRTLRKGPAIVLLAGVLGVVLLAIGFALQPAAPSKAKPEASSAAALQPPSIPDAIRSGPTATATASRVVPVRPLTQRPPMEGPPPIRRASIGGTMQRFARQDQEQKAASAGILFDAKGGPSGGGAAPPPAVAAPNGMTTASARAAGSGSAGGIGEDMDPNRQDRKNAFLDAQGAAKTTD